MNCRQPILPVLLCTALLCSGQSSAEGALGRLFLTPEKREVLDRQRAQNALDNQMATEDPMIEVNGQVRRSSGKRTTWINGQAQNDDEMRTGVIAYPDGSGTERVLIESSDDPRSSVKVGEQINRGTHETLTPLGEGTITIHRHEDRRNHQPPLPR